VAQLSSVKIILMLKKNKAEAMTTNKVTSINKPSLSVGKDVSTTKGHKIF